MYVVDDEPKMRDSLRWLIETPELPVKTFESAETFLEGYDATHPGCLLLDMKMPAGMSGLELLETLRDRGIDVPVIILTGYGDVPMAVDALKLGAIEFLQKPCNDGELLKRIRRGLTLDMIQRAKHADIRAIQERLKRLSRRETEVLQLVVEGLVSKAIARRLDISCKTVDAHRAKIMRKMEAEGLAELVRFVVSTTNFEESRIVPARRAAD